MSSDVIIGLKNEPLLTQEQHWRNQRYGHLIPRASRTLVILANRKNGRVTLQRMDNVGIVVEVLDTAISFFAELASNSKVER